jgi:hypothetical protein
VQGLDLPIEQWSHAVVFPKRRPGLCEPDPAVTEARTLPYYRCGMVELTLVGPEDETRVGVGPDSCWQPINMGFVLKAGERPLQIRAIGTD